MQRARHASVVGAFVVLSALPADSFAHGPCHCTRKLAALEAAPGDRLVIASPAIQVVWNPRPEELRIDPGPLLADDYVAGTPTVAVLPRRGKRFPTPRFRVPEVPDGRYLLAIYDGSEGGNHYTWDYVLVRRPAAAAAGRPSVNKPPWIWLLLAGSAGVSIGALFVAGWRRQTRSQGESSRSTN